MHKTILDFFSKKHHSWDIKLLKNNAKKRYKQIVTELPDIGSLTQNSLRIYLSGGALWLSFYETCEEKITEEEFGEMVKSAMESPLIVKEFKAKNPFTKKAQIKKEKSVNRDNQASNSKFNWKTEFIKGRDEEEYTIIYKQCGLCNLADVKKKTSDLDFPLPFINLKILILRNLNLMTIILILKLLK